MGSERETYTQRDWDRIVGIGKVPPEYSKEYADQEKAYDNAKEVVEGRADESQKD